MCPLTFQEGQLMSTFSPPTINLKLQDSPSQPFSSRLITWPYYHSRYSAGLPKTPPDVIVSNPLLVGSPNYVWPGASLLPAYFVPGSS